MAAQRSDTLIGDEVVRTLCAQGRFSQVLARSKACVACAATST